MNGKERILMTIIRGLYFTKLNGCKIYEIENLDFIKDLK